jgi:predicted nuclease with TOPRIM domain
MDATLAAEFKAFLELQFKGEETEAERVKLLADNEQLTTTNAGLADKIRVLELEKAKTNVEIEAMKELLRVYRHFTNTGCPDKTGYDKVK